MVTKKALKNLFWIAVVCGAIGLISDNCNRAEACPIGVGWVVEDTTGNMDAKCWRGNCTIYSYNGVVSQECETFCNFYCYHADYQIECDGEKCWNTYSHFCRIDGEPHSPKNHHGLLDQ